MVTPCTTAAGKIGSTVCWWIALRDGRDAGSVMMGEGHAQAWPKSGQCVVRKIASTGMVLSVGLFCFIRRSRES